LADARRHWSSAAPGTQFKCEYVTFRARSIYVKRRLWILKLQVKGDHHGSSGRIAIWRDAVVQLKTVTIAAALSCLLAASAAAGGPKDDWQLAMLHDPSEAQLSLERRGRVFIYDGLTERDVELAMNTQFKRVESMMFVRTKVATREGGYAVADDGCD
jgi:hypothetical protein